MGKIFLPVIPEKIVGENRTSDQVCAWCNPPDRVTARSSGFIPRGHGICRAHAIEMLAAVGLEVVPIGDLKIVRRIQIHSHT